ncbi:ribosome biogenesis protein WDR12 homolog [Episyrphus balteatus]|uniref:ribosome biogenesis protein WDR12 homolog n=1 Tax=Episyrphus balteatus TaxID=286459 RepID=UPI0024852A15|nr:ribosome biogenesis protein WDR12 homolog [Episyrphus balteatus]
MDNNLTGAAEIQIRLVTKQSQYAVPDVPYTIDATVSTSDLNNLINTLLFGQSDVKTINFDFLIFNQFLQGSLVDHAKNNNGSFENVIEIEYIEKYPAPEPQDCLLHDDWVSAVKTQGNWILTGCYDNTINIWSTKGTHVLTIPGHSMPVKALSWVSLNERNAHFISVSQDQTAVLWKWNIAENSVCSLCIYKGHQRGIDCVDVNPNANIFATGSWDTVLKLWPAVSQEMDGDLVMNDTSKNCATKAPLMSLQGHKECISAVQWIDSETILSGSWDQTLKIWNLNLEGIQSEITANKSFFDVSYSPLNKLIITASADKDLRLYDSRSNHGPVIRNSYLGHSQWIQSVTWSKTNEYLFLSGGYDNQNKLWDLRSTKASLYELLGHSDKVLDVDWSNPKYFVSGGADNSVRIFKSQKTLMKNY